MNIFIEHPHINGETYLQHMKKAISFASIFLLLTFTSTVHAIFPFLFMTIGSNTVKKLNIRIGRKTI